jgi:hypothetical protein
MKKALVLIMCLIFIGCASTQPNLHPVGKNNEDWLMDEKYCQISSGKPIDLWGIIWPGDFLELEQANERYYACLRAKGWLE